MRVLARGRSERLEAPPPNVRNAQAPPRLRRALHKLARLGATALELPTFPLATLLCGADYQGLRISRDRISPRKRCGQLKEDRTVTLQAPASCALSCAWGSLRELAAQNFGHFPTLVDQFVPKEIK